MLDAVAVHLERCELSILMPAKATPVMFTVDIGDFALLFAVGVPVEPFPLLFAISILTRITLFSVAVPSGGGAVGDVAFVMLHLRFLTLS